MSDKKYRRNDKNKKNLHELEVVSSHNGSLSWPADSRDHLRPYVDRVAVSARAVISTPTIDRVRDVLIPGGCQLGNYEKNPVVLWSHGTDGIDQPIGTSCGPDGNLAIAISDDEVTATCWFAQSSIEAMQIFELIDEGVIRAASVRETPIKSHVQHKPGVGEILIVDEWDLEEWSWCAVGVNPDAVAKALDRNRLGGRPILPAIRKSLIAVAPTPRRFGVGLSKEKQVTDASNYTGDPEDDESLDEETANDWNDTESDGDNQPYGSSVISATHVALSSACQDISSALAPLENPDVKSGLEAILLLLKEQMSILEGLHLASYPDRPQLKSDDSSEDDSGESLKAFLASGRLASLQVRGLNARLGGLAVARNLTGPQRRTVKSISQQLKRLVSVASSQSSNADSAKLKSLETSISELTSRIARLQSR